MADNLAGLILVAVLITLVLTAGWFYYRKILRRAKDYERGLKMVYLRIHLPPSSTDIGAGSGRDERDITDEVLSQAQVMYNIISSTAYDGRRVSLYGHRHFSFEIISQGGMVYYCVAAPMVALDTIKQSITTAYPSARVEEHDGINIFNNNISDDGVIGGELNLKKDSAYPIVTYQESKQDVSRSILNALSSFKKDEGAALQILIRPADEDWPEAAQKYAKDFVDKKTTNKKNKLLDSPGELLEVLWKPPQSSSSGAEEHEPLSSADQAVVDAINNKTTYPAFEVLIRVVVATESRARSKVLLQNIISSFSLFNSPSLNGFGFDEIKSAKELVKAYVMRFFPYQVKDNVLNSIELASIFHLPTQKDIPTSQIKRQSSKQVDGPTDVIEDGLLLGYNEFRGVKKPIRLSPKDRLRHTYFIGQTGTGKSGLLENLAYQDIMDGKGFAFVDPHGDSVERLLGLIPRNRVDDIIYFNPSDLNNPIGLNLFEFDSEDQKDFLVQECIQMLYSLYDPGHTGIIGPRFEHWFRNAALALMSDPEGSSFIDIPQMFNDPQFAAYKLQFVKDQTVRDFWQKEMAIMPESAKGEILGWFASKFGAFLSNEMMRNIIGQTRSGFNMRQIMDNQKILLVNLSKGKTGDLNSRLLGMMFVMKFQAAAMSRADMPEQERKEFCLYVDEFQNFATDSFESILSEARKYKLNLIVANQFMTQLTENIREAIIGNVGTIISGRIGITDAEILEKRFLPTFNAEDLTRLPNYQTITTVMINNTPSNPFSMNLLPPVGNSNPELAKAIKQLSAARFGQNRQQIGHQIANRLSKSLKTESGGGKRENVLVNDNSQSTQSSGAKEIASEGFLDNWLKKRKQLQMSQPVDNGGGNIKLEQPVKTTQTKIRTFSQASRSGSKSDTDFEGDLVIRH